MMHGKKREIAAAAPASPAIAGDVFARARESLGALRPVSHPVLQRAAAAMDIQPKFAEQLLSKFLAKQPRDTTAMALMAETAMRLGQHERAAALFAECVALAPDFDAARYNLAAALLELHKVEMAMEQLEELLARDPCNVLYWNSKAALLTVVGKHADAMACRRQLTVYCPDSAEVWINYGHSLRSVGLRDECVDAYRQAIELCPTSSSAYWSLANLKRFRFTGTDIEQIQSVLSRSDLPGDDRVQLHFVLGKAYEDIHSYQKSFENYARANAVRSLSGGYDPDGVTRQASKYRAVLSADFFRNRAGFGCSSADPIFIVGMQRAGSTLLEQILASHSAVEATTELKFIPALISRLGEEAGPKYGSDFPAVFGKLDQATLTRMGEQYLENAGTHRILGRPYFVDKQPYNFWNVGLIHLMLPNAKIVDVRRHPLGCCLSNFTMNFSGPANSGQRFTNRQVDLGRHYADYVSLMAHYESVLPGKVHRVIYERLVEDLESEVRRLLGYLGLPFEAACLEFYNNDRALDSASSEQVRSPIFKDGIERWRNYEPWLGPLKAALGPVLEAYPGVPEFGS